MSLNERRRLLQEGLSAAGRTPSAVEWQESTSSTMDRARDLLRTRSEAIVLSLADEQTAGRGRAGSSWDSRKGNLFLTLGLRTSSEQPPSYAGFSLVVGVVLAKVLEQFGVTLKLKWPNDCLLPSGRKVGGILIENCSQAQGLLVGIGLNLRCESDRFAESGVIFPQGLSYQSEIDLILMLIDELQSAFEVFREDGFLPFRTSWTKMAVFLGEEIRFQTGTQSRFGTFAGVGQHGELLLDVDGGLEAIISASDIRLAEGTHAARV